MSKQLRVLIDGQEIGTILQDTQGKFRFTYDDSYRRKSSAIPLSLSMPLSLSEHGPKSVTPYLWGLLPDNNDTLTSLGRHFGVNHRNPFSLLSAIGEDLQGAVQMVPQERLGDLKKREGVTPLSRDTIADRFEDLLRDPGAIQFTKGGGQFSLAGAQRKKALYLVNGRWFEPRGRTPTTHILKPPITGLDGQVENEMFCVRLAPRLALPAPRCWIERFGAITVVVIERYDRRRLAGRKVLPIDSAGGEVHRVHQEDCCQALRVHPRDKYQSDGGPGMKAIMELLSDSGKPSEDRDRFMRACALNFIICGTDAHAKNYGLLLSSGGRYRLAPLYDIASWLPYSKDSRRDRLAMSIDRHYHIDRVLPRHWEDQAHQCGYDPDRALAHIRDLIARIPGEARHLLSECKADGAYAASLKPLVAAMIARCTDLAKAYGSELMGTAQSRIPGI